MSFKKTVSENAKRIVNSAGELITTKLDRKTRKDRDVEMSRSEAVYNAYEIRPGQDPDLWDGPSVEEEIAAAMAKQQYDSMRLGSYSAPSSAMPPASEPPRYADENTGLMLGMAGARYGTYLVPDGEDPDLLDIPDPANAYSRTYETLPPATQERAVYGLPRTPVTFNSRAMGDIVMDNAEGKRKSDVMTRPTLVPGSLDGVDDDDDDDPLKIALARLRRQASAKTRLDTARDMPLRTPEGREAYLSDILPPESDMPKASPGARNLSARDRRRRDEPLSLSPFASVLFGQTKTQQKPPVSRPMPAPLKVLPPSANTPVAQTNNNNNSPLPLTKIVLSAAYEPAWTLRADEGPATAGQLQDIVARAMRKLEYADGSADITQTLFDRLGADHDVALALRETLGVHGAALIAATGQRDTAGMMNRQYAAALARAWSDKLRTGAMVEQVMDGEIYLPVAGDAGMQESRATVSGITAVYPNSVGLPGSTGLGDTAVVCVEFDALDVGIAARRPVISIGATNLSIAAPWPDTADFSFAVDPVVIQLDLSRDEDGAAVGGTPQTFVLPLQINRAPSSRISSALLLIRAFVSSSGRIELLQFTIFAFEAGYSEAAAQLLGQLVARRGAAGRRSSGALESIAMTPSDGLFSKLKGAWSARRSKTDKKDAVVLYDSAVYARDGDAVQETRDDLQLSADDLSVLTAYDDLLKQFAYDSAAPATAPQELPSGWARNLGLKTRSVTLKSFEAGLVSGGGGFASVTRAGLRVPNPEVKIYVPSPGSSSLPTTTRILEIPPKSHENMKLSPLIPPPDNGAQPTMLLKIKPRKGDAYLTGAPGKVLVRFALTSPTTQLSLGAGNNRRFYVGIINTSAAMGISKPGLLIVERVPATKAGSPGTFGRIFVVYDLLE